MMDKAGKIASQDSLKDIARWKDLLTHYRSLCENHDSEMLAMVNLVDKARINWKTAMVDCDRLRAMVESLERETKNITVELRSTQEKLRDGQAKNAALTSTNKDLAVEIEQYKKRFDTVKAILKEDSGKYSGMDKLIKLPFFTDQKPVQQASTPASSREASLANTDDIDYDKTGDSFADALEEQVSAGSAARYGRANPHRSTRLKQQTTRSKTTKRRSASQQPPLRVTGNKFPDVAITEEEENASDAPYPTPSKRIREGRCERAAVVESKTPSKHSVAVRRSMNRSFSESNIFEEKRNPQSARVGTAAASTFDIRSPLPGFGNLWTKGQKISECGHTFVPTITFFTGTCNVCMKGWGMCITSKSLKCTDCDMLIHEKCRALAPVPCIPFVQTPQKQKQNRPRLVDYCPKSRPQIPAPIIRCVVAIEKGYLTKEGIYRTPGTMSEVNRLMDAFNSRFQPKLDNYDPDVIAGCIKKFLSELREALIPTSSYKEFVRAAESGNKEQLVELVNGLPIPNRDTLAYMCAHLQKIASHSSANKMPLENLATCIGPTIVGPNMSVKKAGAHNTGEVLEETDEMRRKVTVLLELLKLDNEFWTNFLSHPINNGISTPHAVSRTPAASIRRHVRAREFDADKSFLGPVTKTPPYAGTGLLVQPIRTANKQYFTRPY